MPDEEIKETVKQVNEKEYPSISTNVIDGYSKKTDEIIPDVVQSEEAPVKKRRGRPRKIQSANTSINSSETKTSETDISNTKTASEPCLNSTSDTSSEISNTTETSEKSLSSKLDEKVTEKPNSPENNDTKSDSSSESASKSASTSRSRKTRKPKQKEIQDETETAQRESESMSTKKIDPLSKEEIRKESKKETVSQAEIQDNAGLTSTEVLTNTSVTGTLLVYKTPNEKTIRRAIAGRFEYVSHHNDDVFIMVKYVKPSTGLVFGYVKRSEYIDKMNN